VKTQIMKVIMECVHFNYNKKLFGVSESHKFDTIIYESLLFIIIRA